MLTSEPSKLVLLSVHEEDDFSSFSFKRIHEEQLPTTETHSKRPGAYLRVDMEHKSCLVGALQNIKIGFLFNNNQMTDFQCS